MTWTTEDMARRAAREIPAGSIVNLGIGLPTQVADYLPEGHAWLHSENGLLGMGPFPYEGDEDPNLINAGKQTVTVLPGGSTFDSAYSFGMIRGGHVDLAIMGAMQVSAGGDLANWAVPGGKVMGIGGAMDLASGARRRRRPPRFGSRRTRHGFGPPVHHGRAFRRRGVRVLCTPRRCAQLRPRCLFRAGDSADSAAAGLMGGDRPGPEVGHGVLEAFGVAEQGAAGHDVHDVRHDELVDDRR